MRFINTLALVIAALSITAECQYLSFGGCAQIPDINDFDIEKYKGLWYEIEKIPNTFEIGQKCNTASYGSVKDQAGNTVNNQITVKNIGYFSMFNATNSVDGVATQTEVPNKLRLKFDIKLLGQMLYQTDGLYNVVATDYTNYSIVFTCSETNFWFFKVKRDYAWILARKPKFNSTLASLESVRGMVGKYTDVRNLEPTVQNCYH